MLVAFVAVVVFTFWEFWRRCVLYTLHYTPAINSLRLIRLRGFQLHHCIPNANNFIFFQFTKQNTRPNQQRISCADFHVMKRFVINLCVCLSTCRHRINYGCILQQQKCTFDMGVRVCLLRYVYPLLNDECSCVWLNKREPNHPESMVKITIRSFQIKFGSQIWFRSCGVLCHCKNTLHMKFHWNRSIFGLKWEHEKKAKKKRNIVEKQIFHDFVSIRFAFASWSNTLVYGVFESLACGTNCI